MNNASQPRRRPVGKKRSYHSPIRERQAADTRERIIESGVKLVHGFKDWDWKNLTARAVATGANVSERTVHRHFSTERKLRDAVLERLVAESGIRLEDLRLDNFGHLTGRMFEYLSGFASTPATVEDPSLATIDEQRRMAVMAAVRSATPGWPDNQQKTAAAVLDIAWSPPTYDRLVAAWGLDPEHAVDAIRWLIAVLEKAICEGFRPGSGS